MESSVSGCTSPSVRRRTASTSSSNTKAPLWSPALSCSVTAKLLATNSRSASSAGRACTRSQRARASNTSISPVQS
eukprot:2559674-Rhodomonas_salina.2